MKPSFTTRQSRGRAAGPTVLHDASDGLIFCSLRPTVVDLRSDPFERGEYRDGNIFVVKFSSAGNLSRGHIEDEVGIL
jgi:hypothetical protein